MKKSNFNNYMGDNPSLDLIRLFTYNRDGIYQKARMLIEFGAGIKKLKIVPR